MFSTSMSLEDRLKLKLKVKTGMYGYNAGPPMAIPIYTVLPYCVIEECTCIYIEVFAMKYMCRGERGRLRVNDMYIHVIIGVCLCGT